MIFKRSLLFNIVLALLVGSLVLLANQQGLLKRLELDALDLSFFLKPPLKSLTAKKIVIVEISDKDIVKIGRWPWERSWHAAMIKALTSLGAKYIYFDIIFSEASQDQKNDLVLTEAIKESKNVYLPFVFQEVPYNIKNAFLPIAAFSENIKGTGSINIYPDIDGTTRRIPLLFTAKDKIYPHVALQIAMDYSHLKITDVSQKYFALTNEKEKIEVPFVEDKQILINWQGKWQDTFKHYSFIEILNAYKDILDGKPSKINPAELKDAICLVAVTAIGLYDINSVPLEPQYPGIGIIANTISNIIDKDFLKYIPEWINILLLYLLCLIPAFLIFGEKPLRETLFVFLVAFAYFLTNYILFQNNLVFKFVPALLALLSSYLAIEVYNFVRVSVERQSFFKMSITDGLTSLFNIRYFKMLLETEILLVKSSHVKNFSIIMTDVDHFKHFNDTYGHQIGDMVLKEVARVLKESVRSSDLVARYGGEEMIILLRGTSLNDAMGIAEKIRKNIEKCAVKNEANSYQVTVSLGVSTFQKQDNIDTVIKRADEGLYKAKESGRNRVCNIE